MSTPVRARRLRPAEGRYLVRLVRRGRHDSVRYRRALTVMASAAGTPVPAVARLVAAEPGTVRAVEVELCLTPTNASWADPIEAQFGPLPMFIMAGSDHPNHVALARGLHAYLRWRNANNRHPDVLAAPTPRTSPHPQRTPPTLGPATHPSRLTNEHRDRSRSPH